MSVNTNIHTIIVTVKNSIICNVITYEAAYAHTTYK